MENLLQKTVLKEKTSCFTFIKLHLWSFAETQRRAPRTSNAGQKSFLLTGRNLEQGQAYMGLMVKEEEEKGRAGRETGRKRTHTQTLHMIRHEPFHQTSLAWRCSTDFKLRESVGPGIRAQVIPVDRKRERERDPRVETNWNAAFSWTFTLFKKVLD